MDSTDPPTRFLFLHSETGGGHLQVALAVAGALMDRHGDNVQVEMIDALSAYTPWPLCRFPEWFETMLWGGGQLYGLGFRLFDGQRRARVVASFLYPLMRSRILRLLVEHPADVVVACHPLLVHPLARILAKAQGTTAFVVVGPELAVMHALWADPDVHQYLVATEVTRQQLIRHGVHPDQIEVTGLPVSRSFLEVVRENPHGLRTRLGLDPERPLVLVMGGGEGYRPLGRVARVMAHSGLAAQVVVLTGHNAKLQSRLAAISLDGYVRVDGFVSNLHEWMQAASVVVTKAGPHTIADALVLGVPLVLWSAIPAEETPNMQMVVKAGAAVWAPGPHRTVAAVRQLLSDPDRWAQMRACARKLARPEAAERVAEILWKRGQ